MIGLLMVSWGLPVLGFCGTMNMFMGVVLL